QATPTSYRSTSSPAAGGGLLQCTHRAGAAGKRSRLFCRSIANGSTHQRWRCVSLLLRTPLQEEVSPEADLPDRIDQQGRGWILGLAGVRALEVLEQLSREVRRISGVDS